MPDPTRLGDAASGSADGAADGAADGSPEAERMEAVVRGRVQGVGFRRYVRSWARTLALDGWVRNEPDGTVRLVARGAPAALDRLSRLLWGGSPVAHVEAVEIVRLGPEAGEVGAGEVGAGEAGTGEAGTGFEIRR